jgi:trans-aconitate methyltransferase
LQHQIAELVASSLFANDQRPTTKNDQSTTDLRSMSKEWNAALYHQISTPQVSWGKKVLARTSLRGDETILDAGCGTGRLTRDLLEALPRGRVVALDVSQNMIDAARAYLVPDFGDRVEFVCCDLLAMPFDKEFDGIFSTASFHWVLDHDRLFQNLYHALRPRGWLCAQCGGGRNLDRLLARVEKLMTTMPYAMLFAGYPFPWEYSDAETAAARLRHAGFDEIETSLEDAPTTFPNAQEFQQFVESVILRNHLLHIPEPTQRERFLAELTRQAEADDPPFLLDYVRLNLQGRRPG